MSFVGNNPQTLVEALYQLENSHNYLFRFSSFGETDYLVEYLRNSEYFFHSKLAEAIDLIKSIVDDHFSVIYGERVVRVEIHKSYSEEVREQYEQIADLFDANEKLLHNDHYTWLNRKGKDESEKHYLELNWV